METFITDILKKKILDIFPHLSVAYLLLQKNMPKFNKIPFYLQPHSSSGAKTLKK